MGNALAQRYTRSDQPSHPENISWPECGYPLIEGQQRGYESVEWATLLTKILGLPNGCTQQLVDDGVITSCNSTNVLRDKLFDLRRVSELLGGACQSEASGLIVTPKSKELTSHLTTYGKPFSDVVSRPLNGSIPDSTNLNKIVVSESDFSGWLLSMLREACEDPVPTYKAKAALQCGDQRIKAIVKARHIKFTGPLSMQISRKS